MRLSDRLLRLAPVALLALLAGTAGCGGAEHDAMEKQLGELRGEIAGLRARQAALTERIDTIDVERNVAKSAAGAASTPGLVTMPHAAGPTAPAAPVGRASDRDRPDLDVVRLSPSEGDGDADNDPSRPVVRAAGSAGAAGDAPGSRASQTLNNKNLSSRPRKSVANASPKKTDADARPVAKP
jgi:hypothetical protein